MRKIVILTILHIALFLSLDFGIYWNTPFEGFLKVVVLLGLLPLIYFLIKVYKKRDVEKHANKLFWVLAIYIAWVILCQFPEFQFVFQR